MKIISLKSFAPPIKHGFRRVNAIESILKAKEYTFGRDQVSWMVEGGKYFIHTIDRSQTEYRQ